jgi:hypothetical protein
VKRRAKKDGLAGGRSLPARSVKTFSEIRHAGLVESSAPLGNGLRSIPVKSGLPATVNGWLFNKG